MSYDIILLGKTNNDVIGSKHNKSYLSKPTCTVIADDDNPKLPEEKVNGCCYRAISGEGGVFFFMRCAVW